MLSPRRKITLFDIVSIGQASLDTIENEHGSVTDLVGGGGTYVAVVAAALGARTALVSRVGTDFADSAGLLKRVGVDLKGLHRVTGNSTRIRLLYAGELLKELEISEGVGKDILLDDVPDRYFSTSIVHIAPAPYATQLAAIESLKRAGILISFAPHDDLRGMSSTNTRRLLRDVDVLFANEFEIIAISGKQNLNEAIGILHEAGTSLIVVTQGSRGATISRNSEMIRVPALKPIQIIDHVGAGDAFAAAFLVGILRGFGLLLCGLFGATVAACTLQQFGLVVPTQAEMKEILRSNQSLIASCNVSPFAVDNLLRQVA